MLKQLIFNIYSYIVLTPFNNILQFREILTGNGSSDLVRRKRVWLDWIKSGDDYNMQN
jgi:hypothetical protein